MNRQATALNGRTSWTARSPHDTAGRRVGY